MSRTYLRAASLTAVGLLAAGLPKEGAARPLFDSTALPQESFAVLAQPVGRAKWKLLVLEQIKAQRSWRWMVSGRLARRTWWGLDNPMADRRLERLIHGLSATAEASALSELLFHYKFERYGLRLLPYLL